MCHDIKYDFFVTKFQSISALFNLEYIFPHRTNAIIEGNSQVIQYIQQISCPTPRLLRKFLLSPIYLEQIKKNIAIKKGICVLSLQKSLNTIS